MAKQHGRGTKNESQDTRLPMPDLATIENLPLSYQDLDNFMGKYKDFNPYGLRCETMKRIEKLTGNPLLCYVTQTTFLPDKVPHDVVSIVDNDIEGFDSLIDSVLSNQTINNKNIDIVFVSNGGSPEAAERIVRLLRDNFEKIRFILPGNAFSAATMMAFSSDEIIMTDSATLGPIDPQINGIPARSILRGFEALEKRMQEEKAEALAAYLDLLKDYSLHLLEICKSAEALAKELAREWVSRYVLKCELDDPRVENIVSYFADYDKHKSHGRSIGRQQAIAVGLPVTKLERGTPLDKLVRSLHAQCNFFLNRTAFFKIYENAHGTGFGRQWPVQIQLIPE